MLSARRTGIVAAVLLIAGVLAPASVTAQELARHLAIYEVTTGRAPSGVTPPEVRGTYAYRLQSECDGGLKFEQRLRFEAKAPAADTTIDQTSSGWESTDGRHYRFTHRASIDDTEQPEIQGEVDLGGNGEARARFTRPVGRIVAVTADTMFPLSILRRTMRAARDAESGFEGRFFMGDRPEPPQTVSVLLGKPPRRVLDLPPPQGDRGLVDGHSSFFFHAAFYDGDTRNSGEPRHEMSSVTLDNGVEIWGTHEQGDLRLEYRLIRIEALPSPNC
jgi:hypothetical protein